MSNKYKTNQVKTNYDCNIWTKKTSKECSLMFSSFWKFSAIARNSCFNTTKLQIFELDRRSIRALSAKNYSANMKKKNVEGEHRP